MLKLQPEGFADGWDVGHERNRGVQDGCKGAGLEKLETWGSP